MSACGMDKETMKNFRDFVKKYIKKNPRRNHADATEEYYKERRNKNS